MKTTHPKNQINRVFRSKNNPACSFLERFITAFALLLLCSSSLFSSPASANALQHSLSPYLSMHGADPVDWHPFNAATLAKARQQNRPILISSGYFSCHWCHVMQQENYHNPDIAKQMNQTFINIKIDRELDNELDDYLIQFSRQLTGSAGWPLHVLLTPQGWPFYAFGYVPPKQLKERLIKIDQLWQTNPQDILKLAQQALPKPEENTSDQLNPQKALVDLFQQVDALKDDLSGGLSGSNKFPNLPLLLTLIKHDLPPELEDWLKLTLDQMHQTHLMDAVNGGFFRYTIDPDWQTPHYEKMLYTQAQAIELYSLAAQKFNNPHYLRTAHTTWDYVKTHLWDAKSQLYLGSQSALDQQGQEGGDYLYSLKNLKQRLTPDEFQQVYQDWQLTKPAPQPLGWIAKPTQAHWSTIRAKLRLKPHTVPTDDKALLGWNGLLLSGISQLYSADPSEALRQDAQQLSQRLVTLLNHPLPAKALAKNQPIGIAQLEDWVYGLNGIANLHSQLKPSAQSTGAVAQLKTKVLNQFYQAPNWNATLSPPLPGMTRQSAITDQATPSAQALWLNLDENTCQNGQYKLLQTLHQNGANLIPYASYLQPRFLQCATAAINQPK